MYNHTFHSITMTKKSRIFHLKGIDVDKIDKKYDIKLVSNITSVDEFIPKNTTKLSELTDKSCGEIVSFLDETKRLHKCSISMINFKSHEPLDDTIIYNCYWDRHPIENKPIGCPISYVSRNANKVYYSEISKETYSIKENITPSKLENLKHTYCGSSTSKLSISSKAYYQTDGIFCSFNCCMAFILDNKHNRIYDLSQMLLLKMYNDIVDSKVNDVVVIKPAPHWRLLTEYGGSLSIKEFRGNFNKIEYENFGMIKNFPEFNPMGVLHEEKIKF